MNESSLHFTNYHFLVKILLTNVSTSCILVHEVKHLLEPQLNTKEVVRKKKQTDDGNIVATRLVPTPQGFEDYEELEQERRHCGIHSRLLQQLRLLEVPTESDDEIIAMVKRGDPEGMNKLFNKHHRYILDKIINITQGHWYSDDILQAGAVGLLEAAKRFDPTKKNKFLTYAHYWIVKYIYIEIRNELLPMGGLGIGRDAKERLFNFIKYTLMGMPDEEIMEKLKIGKKALMELKMLNIAASRVRSLDSATKNYDPEKEDLDPYSQRDVPHTDAVDETVINDEFTTYVTNLVNSLRDEYPEFTLFMDYQLGINGKNQLDKKEVCTKLGITKRDYEHLKRIGNKYFRMKMISDGWLDDAKREEIEEAVLWLKDKAREQLQSSTSVKLKTT